MFEVPGDHDPMSPEWVLAFDEAIKAKSAEGGEPGSGEVALEVAVALANRVLKAEARVKELELSDLEALTPEDRIGIQRILLAADSRKRINRSAYEALIEDDLDVLASFIPSASLERRHIEDVLRASVDTYYLGPKLIRLLREMENDLQAQRELTRIAGMDAEKGGASVVRLANELELIRNALGDGSDESLWPPGKTVGEAVEGLVARPNFRDAFEAVNELSPPCDWLKRLRWAKTREDLETLIADAQKESLRRVMAEVNADVCTCENPPPHPEAEGAFLCSGDCPIHGDEDDIEEEPVS
jgi:hypothetical protein